MAVQSRKRVVALIRVSTLKQMKDKEADYQRNQIRLTCTLKDLELVREFPLENISGLVVRHTDQFKAIKKAIARPDIDGLVLPSLSRLGRTTEFQNVAALMAPFEEIMGNTKKLIWSRTEVYDVTIPEDRDRIWNAFKFAEQERSNLKFITNAQKEILRLEADTKVDKLPKGIIATQIPGSIKPKRYKFTYDPEYRKKVAAAYQAVLNDEDLTVIAANLGYGSINGARETLRSEWWIGYKSRLRTTNERKWIEEEQSYFIGGKKPHPNPIRVEVPNLISDPAVSRKVWDAVQVKLAEHTDHFHQRRKFSEELLATGFLYCGVCGQPMYHKGQKSRTHPGYFWCKSKAMSYHKDAKKKTVDCGMGLIHARKIEDDIALQIQMHLGVKETTRQLLNDAANAEAVAEKKRDHARVEQQIEEADNEKTRMLRAIRKGIAIEEEYESDLAEVRRTIKSLESRAASIQEDIDASVSDELREQMAEEMAQEFAHFATDEFDEQVRKMNRHIRKITVTKNEVTDSITLHFDVKTGMPEMLDQPPSFPKDSPKMKPVPPSGKVVGVRLDKRKGTIGGVPGIPQKSSIGERRPTSSP
jgi:DNA invertase Pin-like site-specific DNA recombinase